MAQLGGFDECSDCGNRSPSWASLNRCVILCDDCCSVHRSLGRHISQVKSLAHHQWRESQSKMLRQAVAGGSNKIWEYSILDVKRNKENVKKPKSTDPLHPAKTEFIKKKYSQLAFCKLNKDAGSIEDISLQLYASVRTPNVETSFRLLAMGADPHFVHPQRGNSALHIAVQERQSVQAELLLIYGADPLQLDARGCSPLQIAEKSSDNKLLQLLTEAQYETTDRFCHFTCGQVPDHASGHHFLLPQQQQQQRGSLSSEARSKLAALPITAFQELCRDAYDELDRRDCNGIVLARYSQSALELPFLPLNPHYSAMRNQGRQKLGRLSSKEFNDLLIDLLAEAAARSGIAARYYLPSNNRPASDNTAASAAAAEQLSLSNQDASLSNGNGRLRCLDNGLDDPVYDFVPADAEYACLNKVSPAPAQNPRKSDAAARGSSSSAAPATANPADPLGSALAALYGRNSPLQQQQSAAGQSTDELLSVDSGSKGSVFRASSDASSSVADALEQQQQQQQTPEDERQNLREANEQLKQENLQLKRQLEILQMQNTELMSKMQQLQSDRQQQKQQQQQHDRPSSQQLYKSHRLMQQQMPKQPIVKAAAAASAPAAAAAAAAAAAGKPRPHTTIMQPMLMTQSSKSPLSFTAVAKQRAEQAATSASAPMPDEDTPPPPPPPLPMDEADYDHPPPDSDEEAECDRLVRQIVGQPVKAAAAAAAPAVAPAPAVKMPSHEEVLSLTEGITAKIYKLLEAARLGQHTMFPDCAAAIRAAVMQLVGIVPRVKHQHKQALDALLQATDSLDAECHAAAAAAGDASRRTQRVIQCSFDIAKAAKGLVTLFQ